MTVSEERIKDLMYGRLERLPSYLSATDRVDLQSICTELLAARRENEWVPWKSGDDLPNPGRYWVSIKRRNNIYTSSLAAVHHGKNGSWFPLAAEEDVVAYWPHPLPPPPETAV